MPFFFSPSTAHVADKQGRISQDMASISSIGVLVSRLHNVHSRTYTEQYTKSILENFTLPIYLEYHGNWLDTYKSSRLKAFLLTTKQVRCCPEFKCNIFIFMFYYY